MFPIKSKEYTEKEIDSIIGGLKECYPELTIHLLRSDTRFIRCSMKIGEQRCDTIPVSITQWEDISVFEADKILEKEIRSLVEKLSDLEKLNLLNTGEEKLKALKQMYDKQKQ